MPRARLADFTVPYNLRPRVPRLPKRTEAGARTLAWQLTVGYLMARVAELEERLREHETDTLLESEVLP